MSPRLAIYQGELESIDFKIMQPPAMGFAEFIADVQRRCPPIALFEQYGRGLVLRVLGVYPAHFDEYRQAQGWSYVDSQQPLWCGEDDKSKRSKDQKTTCTVRPDLWHVADQHQQKFLIYCTEPAPESVSHWAGMLSQLLHAHRLNYAVRAEYHADSAKRFVGYTLQASNLVQSLNHLKQQSGNRIIAMLSYTPAITKAMQAMSPPLEPAITAQCGSFYRYKVWQAVNATTMVALEVAYPYRGKLCFELAQQLSRQCALGGLFYASKVAQHVAEDFADGIVPAGYHIVSPESNIPGEVFTPEPLLKRFTSRALHLSTPSTLIDQRLLEHGMRLGANTTGNQMAYFARGAACPFTALAVTANDSPQTATMLLAMLREMMEFAAVHIPLSVKRKHGKSQEVYSGTPVSLPLAIIDPNSHAMGDDFKRYVSGKVPPVEIYENLPIKVLGVANKDFVDYASSQGWQIMERVWDGGVRVKQNNYDAYLPPKVGNVERPSLYRVLVETQLFMVMPVTPTYELVLHWAMLVKQTYHQVEAIFYPSSTRSFAKQSVQRSGLLQALPNYKEWAAGDAVLVIGYAKLTAQYLASVGFRSPQSSESDYRFQSVSEGFSYCLLRKDGYRSVLMVNVDYCFWGSMAGALTDEILKNSRLHSVVYVSKAGQVVGAGSLDHVYIPRSFSLMTVDGDIQPMQLTSHFFGAQPILSHTLTGDHMCVATPLVETLAHVSKMKAYGSVSVDDEAAHLCRVAEKRQVGFGCLFFASDTIPADKKSREQTHAINLTSSTRAATEHKESVLENGVLNRLLPALKF